MYDSLNCLVGRLQTRLLNLVVDTSIGQTEFFLVDKVGETKAARDMVHAGCIADGVSNEVTPACTGAQIERQIRSDSEQCLIMLSKLLILCCTKELWHDCSPQLIRRALGMCTA